MTLRKITGAVAGLALLGWAEAASAAPVTIDFDSGTDGALVGATFSGLGVTFSNAQFTSNFGLPGSSGALAIRAPGTFEFGSGNAIVATFTSLVSFVSIVGIDVGVDGLTIQAFDAGNNLIDSESAFGTGVGVGQFFTLSVSDPIIASVAMFQPFAGTSGDGIVIDDFTFDTAVAAVPEPASIVLLGAGLAGLGFLRRRRAVAA
jgi:hypothetical protein